MKDDSFLALWLAMTIYFTVTIVILGFQDAKDDRDIDALSTQVAELKATPTP